MTIEKIKNTPELVDFMLDKCVLADSRAKVHRRLEEICDIAIKALEQEPSEDCISRQAVINAIANTNFWLSADNWTELMKCINSLPSITPQPKIDTLDKIKAEIDQKQYDFMSDGDYNEGIRFGLMLAYLIIDKYKKEVSE